MDDEHKQAILDRVTTMARSGMSAARILLILQSDPEFTALLGQVVIVDSTAGILGKRCDKIVLDDFYTISPIAHEYPYQSVWHEPAPRKIPFKQAQVRQSFRQSMRSVNRNR